MSAKILLVDDDVMVRRSLSLLLRALGHTVVSVESGEASLLAVTRESFDLALVDLRMPGMSGVEAWSQIRAHDAALVAVLVTAAAEGPALAAENGMLFLAKPLDLDTLQSVLASALARRP